MRVSDEVQYKKIIYRLAGSNESWQSAIFLYEPLGPLCVVEQCKASKASDLSLAGVLSAVPERGR